MALDEQAMIDLKGCLALEGTNDYQFLLYGLRSQDIPHFHLPDLSIWSTNVTVANFELRDDDWPVTVELFELTVPMNEVNFLHDLADILRTQLLNLTNQGATLAWYMFDGAFGGICPLFSLQGEDWLFRNTYGVSVAGVVTMLALDEASRDEPCWRNLLVEAERYMIKQHPNIETFCKSLHSSTL